MKEVYKQKITDLVAACEGRVQLIEKMVDGVKQPNPDEAKQYLREILNGLEKIEELVSIS
jgi:hypothetical protein